MWPGVSIIWLRKRVGPLSRCRPSIAGGREPVRPDAVQRPVDQGNVHAGVAREERRRLVELGPRLVGIDRVVAVRRADVELGAVRDQHERGLAQALAQLLPLVMRAGGVGDLDIVADDDVGAAAGDVGADAARQQRRVAMRRVALDGDLARRPLLAPLAAGDAG